VHDLVLVQGQALEDVGEGTPKSSAGRKLPTTWQPSQIAFQPGESTLERNSKLTPRTMSAKSRSMSAV